MGGAVQTYKSDTNFVNITFSYNTHAIQGSAIYIYDGNATLSNIIFAYNRAGSTTETGPAGGGVYIYNRNIKSGIILNLNDVSFKNNKVISKSGSRAPGGAAYARGYSSAYTITIFISGNSKFENNSASGGYGYGGAIYAYYSFIIFSSSCKATFSGNSATWGGGAIYAEKSASVSFPEGCDVTFSSNSASRSGGAIYTYSDVTVAFSSGCKVTFSSIVRYYSGVTPPEDWPVIRNENGKFVDNISSWTPPAPTWELIGTSNGTRVQN